MSSSPATNGLNGSVAHHSNVTDLRVGLTMSSRNNEWRLNNFDWVSEYLGVPTPAELQDLHGSGMAASLEDIIYDEDDLYFCIAHWTIQNSHHYESEQLQGHRRLLLTQDYSGNICYALPEEDFKTVYASNHDSGEIEDLGIDIPTFINLAKFAKDNED